MEKYKRNRNPKKKSGLPMGSNQSCITYDETDNSKGEWIKVKKKKK